MKRKRQVKKFLEDNRCMINSLMCKEEARSFNYDVVGIIIADIDRQMEDEIRDNGRDANKANSKGIPDSGQKITAERYAGCRREAGIEN